MRFLHECVLDFLFFSFLLLKEKERARIQFEGNLSCSWPKVKASSALRSSASSAYRKVSVSDDVILMCQRVKVSFNRANQVLKHSSRTPTLAMEWIAYARILVHFLSDGGSVARSRSFIWSHRLIHHLQERKCEHEDAIFLSIIDRIFGDRILKVLCDHMRSMKGKFSGRYKSKKEWKEVLLEGRAKGRTSFLSFFFGYLCTARGSGLTSISLTTVLLEKIKRMWNGCWKGDGNISLWSHSFSFND